MRRTAPLPPRWLPDELDFERQPLWQFVFLSLLLHAFAILLFGAPAVGLRDGRTAWGRLDVVLRPAPTPLPPAEPMSFPTLPEMKVEPTPLPPMLTTPRPAEVKVPPPPPVTVPIPEAVPQLRDAVTLPKVEPMPTIRVPVEAPKMPAPLLQPLPSSIERAPLPSVAPVPEIRAPEPVPLPSQLTQPLPQIQERAALPPVETRAIEPPPATPAAPVGRPEAERAPPSAPPSLGPSPETRRPAEPAKDYDPTKPALDPDALRRRAGQIAREGPAGRSLLPFPMPVPPKPKTKLEDAIEKARKPDCRNAYKDLGLAAVVPLIANEFGEGNCRW